MVDISQYILAGRVKCTDTADAEYELKLLALILKLVCRRAGPVNSGGPVLHLFFWLELASLSPALASATAVHQL